ncbi:MAG: glycerol-3-phosphate acyltransferase [Desulfuromonadaceae bacterium]|nr:glycerol-3-phosphate acyltransferase [Desulfuromonadaceae bacterium]
MALFMIVLVAYLIGSIPSGVVLTRLAGAGDVRQQGSGNIGATNVYRVAGKRLGVLTLVADMLKGLIPLLVLGLLGFSGEGVQTLAAIALFAGHCYPVYLGFKGGKGVATALGIYLYLSPPAVGIALLVFAAMLWRWRYVSLASISAASVIPFLVYGFERSELLFLATLVIASFVIYRHRSNIERLRRGTENRFNF